MTRDDIIRMAEEAGFDNFEFADDTVFCSDGLGSLTKFAQLVAAHERDACIDIVLRSVSGSMREDLNCYEAVEKIRART